MTTVKRPPCTTPGCEWYVLRASDKFCLACKLDKRLPVQRIGRPSNAERALESRHRVTHGNAS